MSEKPMTLNEAQQHAHRLARERKAMEFMADVIDAAVWAEDGVKNSELAVENARKDLQAIKDIQDKLLTENVAIVAAQEDLVRHGRELSETVAVYEKTVEVRMAALDGEYEEKAEGLDERLQVLQVQKDELEQQVAVLATEKAHIEGVVEAFRKANTETVK